MKLPFQKIIEIFNELNIKPVDLYYNNKIDELILKVGSFESVYSVGGEGMGDTLSHVFFFKEHDVYIRFEGYYESHSGRDYSNSEFYEVKPKSVNKIVYEAIDSPISEEEYSSSSDSGDFSNSFI